jgi:hypothetical protein
MATMGRVDARHTVLASPITTFEDEAGAASTQPEVPPWNRLGYGNNAIEVTYVDVR